VTDEYVGYKHPPKASRFKPGKSGNPGRPKKDEGPIDAGTILSAPVIVTKNGLKISMDPRQLAIDSQFKRAFKADLRAASACLDKCIAAGLLIEWKEDDHQYRRIVPREWDWDEWHAKYDALGPPPWPGEPDGLVPQDRRDKTWRSKP